MIMEYLKVLLRVRPVPDWDRPLDAEYEPCRAELRQAGLDERELREMDPDDRVAVLEDAKLDPYDFIYLAC